MEAPKVSTKDVIQPGEQYEFSNGCAIQWEISGFLLDFLPILHTIPYWLNI